MAFLDLPNELLILFPITWNTHGTDYIFIKVFSDSCQIWTQYCAIGSAAKHGYQSILEDLLNGPWLVDPDTCSSAMLQAARHGHKEAVILLLERAKNDHYSLRDDLACEFAAKNNHADIFQLLVDNGAVPTKVVDHGLGYCGLQPKEAAMWSNRTIMEFLIDWFHNPKPIYYLPTNLDKLLILFFHAHTVYGGRYQVPYSALCYAACNRDIAAARLLLQYGAKVLHRQDGLDKEDDVRPAGLFLAIEHGHIKVAKLLLKKLQGQGIPTLGGPLLCAAAACGSESLLWKLLEDGHKPDATDGAKCWTDGYDWFYSTQERLQMYTPLVWAAKFGHEDVLLMKAGLDPRMCHALHESSSFGEPPSALELAVGVDALFRVLAGGITNDEFRKDWSSSGKDHICPALAAGWIPQFEIFLERGLKLGHAQAQSDQDLFEADDTEYDFLLDSAAAGGVEMLKYAFNHGLDRPNLSDQGLPDTIRRTIRRKGLS
ncbi:ankyrin repeat-containing domain protein [Aspergillus germanicus]